MDNQYNRKQQLSNGVWVFEDGNNNWGAEVNSNFEMLNDLMTRGTLTIKCDGAVLGNYNGRLDTEVEIPSPEIDVEYATNEQMLELFDND